MELRQLKTFLTVASLLNFNRAAEILNYAQSTVSAQIKALEEELNIPLFDRIGRKVFLTEAGETLIRYAKKMIDIEAATLTDVSGWKESEGSIAVRVPQSIGTTYFPAILKEFKTSFPKVGFNINSCGMYSLRQELRSGIIDIAFLLADSISIADLKFEVLGYESLVVVCHPDHPLALEPIVGVQDIKSETLLLPKHDCSYKMDFEQFLTKEKVTPSTIMEFNSLETIKRCVIKGVGITIIPEFAVRQEIEEKTLVSLSMPSGKFETAIIMIWHKDKWLSPAINQFMEVSRQTVAKS